MKSFFSYSEISHMVSRFVSQRFIAIGCLCGQLFLLFSCQKTTDSQNLQGMWRFAIDPNDQGVVEQWQNRILSESILLPGSLQEQGYGNDVSVETPWTGWVVDKSWYHSPKYEKYRQPGNVKVPFWLNPDKHYVGVAWYQRDIDIPETWSGYPVELELERTHWGTVVYVDGKEIGRHESLSTPCRVRANGLKPGKHTLTLRVDNRLHLDVGVNAHSVSDHTQSNWNGVIGSLRLSVKPSLSVDDVQIYPDVAEKAIRVTVAMRGKVGPKGSNLQLQVKTKTGELVGKPIRVELDSGDSLLQEFRIPMGEDACLWSEHAPNLYTLQVITETDGCREEKLSTFGLREFKTKGTRFEINGHPVFLRGTLECCTFPLTGYPATDHAYWTKIYSLCRAHGLNHVRFHSWCPPQAAFEVADSMGFYLQVECAGWTTVGNGAPSDRWFREESDRILKEYGNHPSFCMMAYGNEPGGSNQDKYLAGLIDYWKSKDVRRVYTSAGGWPYLENADYWDPMEPRIQRWAEGMNSIINAQSPRTDFDFTETIRSNMPTVSHEVGQWCVYPNFQEIAKYTGVLKAKNFEIFRESLKEHHLADLAEEFLYASGRLQTLCYKADIEAALRTPGFAGFQLLGLNDFPGQGTALVGTLDAFWDEKGYVSPEEFRMFCNQTVPLVRFPKMIWLNNEVLRAPIELAHFGSTPLEGVQVCWQVSREDGTKLAEGSTMKDVPIGNCIPVGQIEYALNEVDQPSQLTIRVEVPGTEIRNQWQIWVYPAHSRSVSRLPYMTSRLNAQVVDRLEKGEDVLLLLRPGCIRPEKGGRIQVGFSSIFWNTAWTNKQPPHTLGIFCNPLHPALSAFPTEAYSDYQWWDLLSDCSALVMDDFPVDFRPIVHLIDDWFENRKLGILFEGKVGKGRLMVCSVDLERNLDQRPAARQFRQSILEYMASDRFRPTVELDPTLIRDLYEDKTVH